MAPPAGQFRPTRYLTTFLFIVVVLYALVFVSPAELKTMTVGVFSELIRGDIYYWGSLMAGACIGSLPIVIAYVFFLDYYVSGLTAGAIK